MPRYINVDSALQAHPEFLNEQIDDHDKAVYAKGWNACNSAYYDSIKELTFISLDEVQDKLSAILCPHNDHVLELTDALRCEVRCKKCGRVNRNDRFLDDEEACNIPSDCPIIELPEHGDLIDRNEAIKSIEWKWAGKAAFEALEQVPAVIQSNKEETE